MAKSKHLTRSKTKRMIAGVCGGVADYYGWNLVLVRFVFVIASVISQAIPGILLYILAIIIIPEEK